MPIRVLLSLLIPFLCLQNTPLSLDDSHKMYEMADAYEVYSAILPSGWPWQHAKAKRLVIRRQTRAYENCLRPEKEYEEIVGPAISDYVEQNQQTWLLQSYFRIERPYEIIESDEIKSMFEQGLKGWKTFYEKYPDSGGWIELSAVGFNADRTVAVVYMGHHCGGLCGGGGFHVLEKKEGRWVRLEWKGTSCGWAS